MHKICPVSTLLAELLSKRIVIDEREGSIVKVLLTICFSPVSVKRELSQRWLVPQFLLWVATWILKSVSQGLFLWHFPEKQICVSRVTPVAIQSRMLSETT